MLGVAGGPAALLARLGANRGDKGENPWLCWLSTGGGFPPHPAVKQVEMFVLGNRRRWKEPPSCLAQLRAEKRLWSSQRSVNLGRISWQL